MEHKKQMTPTDGCSERKSEMKPSMVAINMQREEDRLKQKHLTELLDKREATIFDLKQNKKDLQSLGRPASFFNDLMTSSEWANYMTDRKYAVVYASDIDAMKTANANVSAINEKLEKENASLWKMINKLKSTAKKTSKKK